MKTSAAVTILSGLAQQSRLDIFRLLVQAGAEGLTAGRISDVLGVSPSSLSFHLKELTIAKLVTSQQDGRFIIYAANYKTMNALIAFLTENCCAGEKC